MGDREGRVEVRVLKGSRVDFLLVVLDVDFILFVYASLDPEVLLLLLLGRTTL